MDARSTTTTTRMIRSSISIISIVDDERSSGRMRSRKAGVSRQDSIDKKILVEESNQFAFKPSSCIWLAHAMPAMTLGWI